jgi:hypothetical protein
MQISKKVVTPTVIPDLKTAKATKLAELSEDCNNTIYAGCDVTLSDGTTGHISLTLKDQYNISEAKSAVEKGASGAPYHLDGGIPCHFYSAVDIMILYVENKKFVLYHTTYCNHLNAWVRRCASTDEVLSITYGSDLPEDLASNMQTVLERSYKELQNVG